MTKSADSAQISTAGLARSAGLIGAATMASRVLGLVRDQVLAYLFGASDAMDAYYVAFRIPNLVRDLFAEGAMSAAFVPTFTKYLSSAGKEKAWHLGRQVITALVVVTGTLVVLGMIFTEPLVLALARDYAQVPGKFALTVLLTRIQLPFLTLVAVAVALMGMLNSLNRFFIPALAPAMLNIAVIVCALVLVPVMPALGFHPVVAVAVGVLVGGVGQVVVQWPLLRRQGFRFRPVLDTRDKGLQEVLFLMGPGTIGLAAVQINLLVNTVLATGEGTGAVSWLTYAFRLMYLPIGLFGVSIATAALPAVSRHAARDEVAGMQQTISSALRMMLMLNVPAALGLIVLASPIVALIFQHGSFTTADSQATAIALMCYAPGLVGYSAVRIISPTFYALGESRTPVMVSVATVALNVVLNVSLVRVIGYRGLALGTSVAALFNASLLLWLLRQRLGGIDGPRLARAAGKIVVAATFMGLVVAATDHVGHTLLPGLHLPARLLRVGVSILAGVVSLGLSARLLRISEFDEALRRVLATVSRRLNTR